MRKIRILIVDDQPIARKMIRKGLSSDPAIEVVAEAGDAYEARDRIIEYSPDVMTLDVEMPKMSGLEFIRKLLPQYPIPVIMVSSSTAEGTESAVLALELGAFDFIQKPDGDPEGFENMASELTEKIKSAADVNINKYIKSAGSGIPLLNRKKKPEPVLWNLKYRLIAIGASTGGTAAIRSIVSRLSPDLPGIVTVIHMPAGFTKAFADRLNDLSPLQVSEAYDGEEISPGKVLIAPGDLHLTVSSRNGKLYSQLSRKEKVSGHRPSVDSLFSSIAEAGISEKTIGIILTGMGSDGAEGLLRLRNAGALTAGQDKETSTVYGMPKAAWDLGAVQKQLRLEDIPIFLRRNAGRE
ncbi:MAG TPA: chemotaxis response regulator protein-glutamate methylesterase [Leptospiraceae bacterium]|nr:chemotaxis response regulator protein-glutamate methylesterase [Leptospiraceae bacterium]HMY68181.1 chemotaxis response regulator protein-glutamate methylesterase [Leptospiraceae bacterium]HNF12249.1 chemotaxis response regulator protein-glutamate methylesterase [Leptospiraceae bacterium]HNF23336.1 chemotaxis response regulator protein-glutamate methylesterase [Leptospiraceae bacterium]HNH08646.1 chemotaxis response regulator protein-glutamate methylesterase [Leptospiraceae bacterium]